MALEFRILGPLEVVEGDSELPLAGAKQRALLAILLVHPNQPVSVDVLSEGLWGEKPPLTAVKMIQGYVSQLRKVLGEGVLVTRAPGYVARVDVDELDASRFERLVADAAGRPPDEAAALLDAALRLWRGAPLADFAYEAFAQTEIARLQEARLIAIEERVDADLARGRHARVVPELEALVAEHPFRERLFAQLMLALYRCGRQAEALEAYRSARHALDQELGLAPSPLLRELEQQILAHDPALEAPPRRAAVPPRLVPQGRRIAIAGALPVAAAAAAAGWELARGSGGGMEREFLERDRETEALGGWLDDVERSGAGVLVLVAGEAGVGKTTLVRRFCGSRGRSRVFSGVCDPLATPAPLGPVVEVAAQLGGASAEVVVGSARPYEVGRALIEDLAGEGPSVVVLEDLHWADEGTIDVLLYVARRIDRAPALIIGTYRDDLDPSHPLQSALGLLATAPRVERLSLGPLSLEAVCSLADAVGRDGDVVFATTRGNPFFVGELLSSAPGQVPATVRDAVLGRVSQLDNEARTLLEFVSVARPQAELWLLDAVPLAGGDALERCLNAGMLERRPEAVSFRHELARLAVEQALSPDRAAGLHRQVLRALERAGTEPARLVHHAEAAGEAGSLLRHATAAGARSAELGAHREAAAQYGRALSVADSLPAADRAELLSRYAFERYLTDRLDKAIQAQREAVEVSRGAGDHEGEGDGLRRLSRFLWFGGRNDEAEAAAWEAIEVLEPLPEGATLARAYSNVSQLRMLAYDCPAAIEWGTRALRLAEQCQAEEIVVHALANVGSAEMLAGREASGRATLEESLARALALKLEDDVGRAYANLATPAVERRQFAFADRYLADGVAYCDEHDLVSYGIYLRAWRARLALDGGRWGTAAELVTEVLAHQPASPPTRIVASIVAGLLAIRTGEAERGNGLLDEALTVAAPTGELQRLAPVAAARAEAAWLRGDTEGVDEATAAVAALAAERHQSWLLGDLAVWRQRAGLAVHAGEVSPPVEAELAGNFAEASSLWSDLGCPYEAALALAGAEEEPALRRALAELQRLGATPAARIVARKLRAGGARSIPRGPYRAAQQNPAGLTARELEVLALLTQPLSNAAIARQLVLSPRTIDHHVSNILAKLGARNRTEAVAAARQLGVTKDP